MTATPFRLLSRHAIPALQATIEQYVEPASGARHVHMATAQEEMAFLVGFPTVPPVSDGRAHVLEHLALCGSQRYPVADPFFAMMRRSTASFMNAMTYADRTVYPFASTDRTDFFNLLDVYLDATFFPRLDYLSFLQEGWRHTLEDGRLAYQGVVFNEMKGAYNNPVRALRQGIASILLEGTTYACDSGGDPLAIPDLTHALLKEFHASHYHPSQAMFMTAGPIDASEIQVRIGERVLSQKPGNLPRRLPGLAAAWRAPRRADIAVPSQAARPDEFGVQLAWLLGEASDPLAAARAYLLMRGLLGNASAPVVKAMESAGFGRPSAMNGSDSGARQIVFHLGMEGLREAQVDAAHACMRGALERTADAGVPVESLQAALRDLRFDQREIRGGGVPDGLGRLLRAVPMMMYGGDVLAAFDNDALLDRLEAEISEPAFFKRLVRDLIDNPSCLIARVLPDAGFFAKRAALEHARLADREAGLGEAERQRIHEDDAALGAMQNRRIDQGALPRIRPADVGRSVRPLPSLHAHTADSTSFGVASNGVSYAHVFHDVSHLPEDDWPWLALYAAVLPELGAGGRGFEEASAWRQSRVPRFAVSFDAAMRAGQEGLGTRIGYFACALRESQTDIARVIQAWTHAARFDETARLEFLIQARIEHKLLHLASMGNQYAALAATAPLSEQSRFDHIVGGSPSLAFCGTLRALLDRPAGVHEVAARLHQLHRRVVDSPRAVVCCGAEPDNTRLARLLQSPTGALAIDRVTARRQAPPLPRANTALVMSSPVNHCVIAWAVPGMADADAAPLAVAAELMTHTSLHQSLREKGGAYGGSASYAEATGIFSMASYRDPRLAGTYADFDAALDRLLTGSPADDAIEEAIIGVIKRLDKPRSPHAQAMEAWNLHERGMTGAMRQQFRDRVLACTLAQAQAAARRWLKNGEPSRAAAVGHSTQDLAGLQPLDLLELAR